MCPTVSMQRAQDLKMPRATSTANITSEWEFFACPVVLSTLARKATENLFRENRNMDTNHVFDLSGRLHNQMARQLARPPPTPRAFAIGHLVLPLARPLCRRNQHTCARRHKGGIVNTSINSWLHRLRKRRSNGSYSWWFWCDILG